MPWMVPSSLARRCLRCVAPVAFSCVSMTSPAQSVVDVPDAATTSLAPLPPVVVTAARSPQPITDLLADVTLITRDDIERSGAASLAQLLQQQPGVEIQQFGGAGSTSGVFLRGANTAQTLVLIDGLRTGSSTAGTPTLEAIPLEQIDHIEILRGPASSLYGADAIGGVIQVFTRRATGAALSANASVGYGTFDTAIASAGASGSAGPAHYSVQLSGRHSDGFNTIVNPANLSYDPDRDGYREGSANVSGGWNVAPGHDVSAQYWRSRLNNQFDAGDAYDDRTISTLENWQVAARDRWSPWWSTLVQAGNARDDSVSRIAFGPSPFRTDQHQYTLQSDFTLPSGQLTVALDRREERVSTDPAFDVTSRDTNSVTSVYQLVQDAQSLQANLRYDHSSQFGGRTTGALLYGYRASAAWRFKIGGGTAFRVPTFNDLYYPGFSNPNLAPETSRSVEGSVHWTGALGDAQLHASATGWYNKVRDLIVFGCDANFVCIPNNVDTATLDGVTLDADARWSATRASGSLTLQSPHDDATGALLPRRAHTHGSAALLQSYGPATVGAEVVASTQRYDDVANTRRMGGYAIVNLTADWALSHGVTLFVRVDNVFDKNYELAADYATGGTRVFGGARWRL